jgi:hypothetical protein
MEEEEALLEPEPDPTPEASKEDREVDSQNWRETKREGGLLKCNQGKQCILNRYISHVWKLLNEFQCILTNIWEHWN